jgi:hypothetical protein
VASSAAVGAGTGVGLFYETQSSKGGRYTVTLPDGTKVEEVNKITAAQMVLIQVGANGDVTATFLPLAVTLSPCRTARKSKR